MKDETIDITDMTDEELIKEVYVQFGLAYYKSECLHKELCNIYAMGTFRDKSDVTRPRFEEKLSYAFSRTLGQLIEELKDILPAEILAKLESALEDRNFLAHRFWFERIHLMYSEKGLYQMIEELQKYTNLFCELENLVLTFFEPIRNKLGITDTFIEKQEEEILSGRLEEPLPRKRKLAKKERIVRAWEFKLPDGKIPMVFETEDGCLWQLCDVGLGWTDFEKIGPDWRENEEIQPYLPATINSRPKNCQPWNYEFHLSKNTVLQIIKGSKEKTFKWNIVKKRKSKSEIKATQ